MPAFMRAIPLVSFAALRGRCRACGMSIPWRYPIVEAVTGALFGAAALAFGPTLHAGVAAALLAALFAITMIDLERQIIPDVISLPGILAGVLANLATGRVSWLESVVGIVVGGGVFLAIAVVGSWLAGQDAMGGGDIKLAAMLGAFLGWKVLLLSLFVSAVESGLGSRADDIRQRLHVAHHRHSKEVVVVPDEGGASDQQ